MCRGSARFPLVGRVIQTMIDYVKDMWALALDGDRQGVLFLVAVYALVICVYSFVRQLLVRQWPCVSGVLLDAAVKQWGGTEPLVSEQDYKVDSLYEYVVSGQTFRGTRVSPWVIVASHNARFLLRRQLNKIRRHKDGSVDVFYNPKKPEKSFLIRPGMTGLLVTLAFAVLPSIYYALEFHT